MSKHPCGEAHIEGGYIVIRVPIVALRHAGEIAQEKIWGKVEFAVTNEVALAQDMVTEINRESETGETKITRMLDNAVCEAIEAGSWGVTECPEKPNG